MFLKRTLWPKKRKRKRLKETEEMKTIINRDWKFYLQKGEIFDPLLKGGLYKSSSKHNKKEKVTSLSVSLLQKEDGVRTLIFLSWKNLTSTWNDLVNRKASCTSPWVRPNPFMSVCIKFFGVHHSVYFCYHRLHRNLQILYSILYDWRNY